MHETHETALVPTRGHRFDDETRQLAYELWLLKADRNATRTQQMLAEQIRAEVEAAEEEFGPIDDENVKIPTVRQVQNWAKDGNWAERAADDIARIAPKLYKDANARLFALVSRAQEFDADVLAGKYGNVHSPGVLAVVEKVAARVQAMAGVGMAGVQQTVVIPQPSVKQIEAELSAPELGQKMHEKLMEFRERR